MSGLVLLLWSTAAALVLIVAGIFAALVMMDRISLFPEAQRSQVQQPGLQGVVDTSYRVMILNATPEEGLAGEVRTLLLREGWSADLVFGSDGASEEFEQTTVFYVDEADEAAALGLADLLGGADVQQSDFYAGLNDSETPQLTVVIGLDRTTPGSGTPSG